MPFCQQNLFSFNQQVETTCDFMTLYCDTLVDFAIVVEYNRGITVAKSSSDGHQLILR